MKVFVIGAAGTIGAQVVRRLRQNLDSVICLVSRDDDLKHLEDSGATIVEGSVTDRASLRAGMEGCGGVVNLAEVCSCWEPDRRIYEEVNVAGTRNVMECALSAGVAKVVHLSTAIVYRDPAGYLFQKKRAVDPARLGEYIRTKYEGDQIAWELYQKKALPLVVVYAGSPVGLNDKDATTQHIKNVIGRRVRVRAFDDVVTTYVSVADVAAAVVKALEKEHNIGERYLIGGAPLSVREFDEILSEITGVPLARVHVPEFLVRVFVALSTSLARLIKRPPVLGISADSLRVFARGLLFDGSKAQKELDLAYTPIKDALAEAISAMQSGK